MNELLQGGEVRLTQQQQRVTALVAEGKTNRQVARAMHIAEKTAKNHLHEAFTKTHSTNRVELTLWWLRDQEKSA